MYNYLYCIPIVFFVFFFFYNKKKKKIEKVYKTCTSCQGAGKNKKTGEECTDCKGKGGAMFKKQRKKIYYITEIKNKYKK